MTKKSMRLDKMISSMGYGSRKEIKTAIKKGEIKVDGKIVKDPGLIVDPYTNTIKFRDNEIKFEEYQYFMLNKPGGVITATKDDRQKTVLDLIDNEHRKDLFPIGRLDKDTEGLLIITNDGELCHNLLSPKKHVEKTYYAKIDGIVKEDDIIKFKEGVVLDTGYKTMPAKLTIINSGQISEVIVIIKEGKFHQIKKMFEAVDKKVVYLKRLAMGSLKLDENLALGEYRKLTEKEVNILKNS